MSRIMEENFEMYGYQTFADGIVDPNNIINPNYAIELDSNNSKPSGSGSECFRAQMVDAAAANCRKIHSSTINNSTVRFYILIKALGSLAVGESKTIAVLQTETLENVAGIIIRNAAGTYIFKYFYYSGGALQVSDDTLALSANKWYKLEFKYNLSTMKWGWKRDNTIIAENQNLTVTILTPKLLRIGPSGSILSNGMDILFDLIVLDDVLGDTVWIGDESNNSMFLQPDYRLTYAGGASYTGAFNGWIIAVDSSNRIHITWKDNRNAGIWEIYYKRYVPGSGWSSDVRLTNYNSDKGGPTLAMSEYGGNTYIHIAWGDKRTGQWNIRYMKSSDGGATWSSDNVDLGGPVISEPCIAAYQKKIYIFTSIGTSPPAYQIRYKRSINIGGTWDSLWIAVSSVIGGQECPSAVVTIDKTVHVVWQDNRHGPNNPTGGYRKVYYRRCLCDEWDNETRLVWEPTHDAPDPSIAVGPDGKVHVVWHDNRKEDVQQHRIFDIYYKKSDDKGKTWLHNIEGDDYDTMLTDLPDDENDQNHLESDLPCIAVSSNNWVHVVWTERNVGADDRLMAKYRYHDGTNWSNTFLVNDCGTYGVGCNTGWPTITADQNNDIHIIFCDQRTGSAELYYRKGIYIP